MHPGYQEQLPGVVRTHAVAHRQLTDQLAYAEFRSTPTMWVAVLPGLILLPMFVGGSLFGLVLGGPSMWQYHTPTSLLLLAAAPLVSAVLLLGLPIAGSIARGRWRWRHELPPGTPIHADFGPEWIGIGWAGEYRAVMLTQLQRVRRIGPTLVLSGGGNTVLLPGELVPAGVAADLLSGGWRRHIGPPMSQQLHQAGPVPAQEAVRAQAVADEGLADRLASASRRSPAMRLTLCLMLVMPVLAVLVLNARYDDVDAMTLAPVILVFGSGGAVLAYYLFYGIAAKLRQLVPPGASISADYGPDWIGVRLGGYVQTTRLTDIKRVDDIGGAVVLTLRGLRPGMMIPKELVPPQVGAELLGRYGQ